MSDPWPGEFSPNRVVTLTTDFGTSDGYVGAMKGVLLALDPMLRPVDLAHDVAPWDVRAGAAALATSAPWFPAGTVHLAVVDPGVGTSRAGIAVLVGGHALVGPDNGLLLEAAGRIARATGAEISCRRLDAAGPLGGFLPGPTSATFHGRDLFAPAAGALASGQLPPAALGPEHRPVALAERHLRRTATGLEAEIVRADRFGNLITSASAADLASLGPGAVVEIEGTPLRLALRSTYGTVPTGELLALTSSDGFLEIAVRDGSASDRLGVCAGTRVRVTRAAGEPPGPGLRR